MGDKREGALNIGKDTGIPRISPREAACKLRDVFPSHVRRSVYARVVLVECKSQFESLELPICYQHLKCAPPPKQTSTVAVSRAGNFGNINEAAC